MMDWEPEIPGQFDTPLRIRRKRSAAEAGLPAISSGVEWSTSAVKPSIFGNNYFHPVACILATFRIVHHFFSTTIRRDNNTQSKIFNRVPSRRVIEIKQITSDGQESVKRRATESEVARPIVLMSPQLARSRHQSSRKKSTRKFSGSTETLEMAPVPNIPPPRNSLESSVRSLEKIPTSCIPVLPGEAPKPVMDREAQAAKIRALFTPNPLPSVVEGEEMISSSATASSTLPKYHTNELQVFNGTINRPGSTDSVDDEPHPATPPRAYSSKIHKIMKTGRTYFQPASTLSQFDSQRSLAAGGFGGRRSIQKRQSYPPSSGSSMRESFTLNRTVSGTRKIGTRKKVEFAIDPIDGLPQKTSARFYKDSIVGDWVPSSPWAEEQASGSRSDLGAQLEKLSTEEASSPPPTTPSQHITVACTTTIGPCEDPPHSLEPNHICSAQDDGDSSAELALAVAGSINSSSTPQGDFYRPLETRVPIQEYKDIQTIVTSQAQASPRPWVMKFLRPFSYKLPTPQPNISLEDTDHTASHDAADPLMVPSIEPPRTSLSLNLFGRPARSQSKDGIQCKLDGALSDTISKAVDSSSNGHLSESGDISKSDISASSSQKKDSLENEFRQLGISEMEMSQSMTEKRDRQRIEREAAQAAKDAAAAKAKAEAEEAERKARSRRRLPKQKLVQPLSNEWEARIDEALHKGDHISLTTTVSGTELRRRDLMTVLGEREWLNDEIINAYLEWIVEYANEKAGKNGRIAIPKVIAHNSFFYKNIATKGPNSVSRWMKRKRAEGKKLLEVETVLIPVNNAAHWTIIVVSPKLRTIEYLDSFAGSAKVFINHTVAWLAAELGDAWHEDEWKVLDTRSAEQMNGYDCGVFTITNAECVAGGVDTNSYDGRDMAAQRRRIAGVLLNRGFGGDFIPAEEL